MENFKSQYQEPTPEPAHEKQKSIETMLSIHRGIWAERLNNGQELPIGGSLFSKELTTKLELDLEAFDEQFGGFTEENIRKVYEQSKDSLKEWLEKVGSDIDPYTYFICYQAQQKVHKLLEVGLNTPTSSFERQKMY